MSLNREEKGLRLKESCCCTFQSQWQIYFESQFLLSSASSGSRKAPGYHPDGIQVLFWIWIYTPIPSNPIPSTYSTTMLYPSKMVFFGKPSCHFFLVLNVKISDTGQTKFHLCVCKVGDSLAYVYSNGQVGATIAAIIVITKIATKYILTFGTRISVLVVKLLRLNSFESVDTTGARGDSGKPRHHGKPRHARCTRSPWPRGRTQS